MRMDFALSIELEAKGGADVRLARGRNLKDVVLFTSDNVTVGRMRRSSRVSSVCDETMQ
jgi:hypothetical protein